MPNWTTNNLVIHEDDLKLIVNEGGHVDFNLLRPQPETLVVSSWSPEEGRIAVEIAAGNIKEIPEEWNKHPLEYELANGTTIHMKNPTLEDWKRFGSMLTENHKRYGASNWYDWNNENWGTKWNACDTIVTEPDEKGWCIVSFDTAWAQPEPDMMEELAGSSSHPIYMESTYEGESFVTEISGRRLDESEWLLHHPIYCMSVPENDLDFSEPITMFEPDERWLAVDSGQAEGYAWVSTDLAERKPSEVIETIQDRLKEYGHSKRA